MVATRNRSSANSSAVINDENAPPPHMKAPIQRATRALSDRTNMQPFLMERPCKNARVSAQTTRVVPSPEQPIVQESSTSVVDEFSSLSRAELQKRCKALGIRANQKNVEMIEALRQHAKCSVEDEELKSLIDSVDLDFDDAPELRSSEPLPQLQEEPEAPKAVIDVATAFAIIEPAEPMEQAVAMEIPELTFATTQSPPKPVAEILNTTVNAIRYVEAKPNRRSPAKAAVIARAMGVNLKRPKGFKQKGKGAFKQHQRLVMKRPKSKMAMGFRR